MKRPKQQNFSRFNQPVPCRGCSKLTTWSEANGNGGLDLCKDCFEAASMDNEHWDGYHTEPKADCRLCAQEGKQ